MPSTANRSQAVIDDYRKRKLKRSALRRIQDLLLEFDRDRAFDRRLAWIGMLFMLLVVGVSIYWLVSTGSTTLS